MENKNTLTFNLERKSRPVVFIDPEGGKIEWELREMSAADRGKFLTDMSSRMTGNGEDRGVKNFDGLYAALLTKSVVRKVEKDGVVTWVALKKEEVDVLPSHVAEGLYRAAQEINAIGVQAVKEDAEKND